MPDMTPFNLNLSVAAARSMLDEPRQYLGASEIGLCPRKAQYRLRWALAWHSTETTEYKRVRAYEDVQDVPMAPDAPDLATLGKFKMGEHLEPFILKFMEKAGFRILDTGREQRKVCTANIIGHPDGWIEESPTGEWDGWLVEVKTTHPFSYSKTAVGSPRKGVPPEGPKEWHKDQVTVYCVGLEAPGCLFVYYDRGTGNMMLMPYQPEAGRFTRLSRKAAMVRNFKELPPMEPVAQWECKSCPFRRQCVADGGPGH